MSKLEFEDIVISHKESLDYFALSLTSNKEESRDLVQETMLKALLKKEFFKEDTNIKAWLFTILKNIFINNYRRRQRINLIMDSNFDLIALGNLHKSDYTRADEELNIKEIKCAIDTLDDHQKIPFEMVQQGYKYNEIAEIQNINIGTVKSRIHMARKNIIKALES